MTFGEKVSQARIMQNLMQEELAEKIGVTARTVYNYERSNTLPKSSMLIKLANVLGVSVAYLINENEKDRKKDISHDLFMANVKNEFGPKGVYEATKVLEEATALFAGGTLEPEAKDIFIQSLMEVYLESKYEAREKFTPKMRKRVSPRDA